MKYRAVQPHGELKEVFQNVWMVTGSNKYVHEGVEYRFREEYIRNRNLIGWNFYNPLNPTEQGDIVINFDYAKDQVVMKKNIPVIANDSLIRMKEESGRKQDLADVAALRGDV